ncbi:MAG: nucleotidyltransferase domain-containing protein [Clostridia bacterium]|jgi:predicted nucleotidyltransferase|nr:nucleotidyltransferase domain-containing protein [Clostridia bacterium]
MVLNIKQEVNEVVKQINAVTSVQKIYLFGSYAYGKADHNSDLDLCIITNDNNVRKRDLIRSIRKSISKVATKPIDILVYNQEDFLERAKVNSTLEHKITNEGVSVYEQ